MSKKIIDLIATLMGIQLFFSISVAQEVSADLTQKIQQIRQAIEDKKMSYWPSYLNESLQNCKILSTDATSLNQCVQKLIDKSERVLTCEKNINFWREISHSTEEDKSTKELLKPTEKLPIFIQTMFDELSQSATQMLVEKTKGFTFPIENFDPIIWTIRGYVSEEFNASSISHGHVEISSAFWSKESSFEPNEIRAILAHEISHVLLNHPLIISCLAYEWQQGAGDIKEAVQYFFDPNPGPRYEVLSQVSNIIEYSADEFAMTILKSSGYDSTDMIHALERLEKFPIKGPKIDDHPEMQLRIERLKQLIPNKNLKSKSGRSQTKLFTTTS